MCDIASAVMIGVALVGGYMQYDASKQAQRYTEQVADQNQKIIAAQVDDTQRQGQIEESERRLKTRLQLAEQTVGFAAQNVAPTGTALDILGDTAMFGEMDVQRIRANTQRRVWGFGVQSHDIEANKRLAGFQGKVQRQGTILSTIGGVAGGFSGGMGGGGGGGTYGINAGTTTFV